MPKRTDLRSILMLMSPDVEIIQSNELPWGGNYLGHDGVNRLGRGSRRGGMRFSRPARAAMAP